MLTNIIRQHLGLDAGDTYPAAHEIASRVFGFELRESESITYQLVTRAFPRLSYHGYRAGHLERHPLVSLRDYRKNGNRELELKVGPWRFLASIAEAAR